jgi:hypothetical protein
VALLVKLSAHRVLLFQFDVYKKWSMRQYQEALEAFKSRRTESSPTHSWHQDELSFFDDHVIPLAERLKKCGVFGDASDECLYFALDNRARWELEGAQIVGAMTANFEMNMESGEVTC